MQPKRWHAFFLLAIAGYLSAQQPKSPQPATAGGGVFLGRSGKPMAGARLILCEVLEDRDSFRGRVRLLSAVPTATAAKDGRFEFRGFAPGRYTILYLLAGVNIAVPNEITVSMLDAMDKSIAPLLRKTELGTNNPYEPRAWGPFTLMRGHTFMTDGPQMRIWNATARRGKEGPFLEIRRGSLWMQQFADKVEIKFDAWSF